jgi:hypothetical protein
MTIALLAIRWADLVGGFSPNYQYLDDAIADGTAVVAYAVFAYLIFTTSTISLH